MTTLSNPQTTNVAKTPSQFFLTQIFTVPSHFIEPLINFDYSDLLEEDKKQLQQFLNVCQSTYGSVFFTLTHNGDNEYLSSFENIYCDRIERYCMDVQLWY